MSFMGNNEDFYVKNDYVTHNILLFLYEDFMVNTMNQWWIGEINGGYTKKNESMFLLLGLAFPW